MTKNQMTKAAAKRIARGKDQGFTARATKAVIKGAKK